MEVVAAAFAANTEATGVVGAAFQAALDFLADTQVFLLDLIGDGNAALHEVFRLRIFRIGKVEIEDNPAGVGTVGQDKIGVHDPFVEVDHEVGEDPGVIGISSLAHRGNVAVGGFEWADLDTGMTVDFGAVFGVVENASKAGVDGVDVVTAVEVVVDKDLPVTFEVILLAGIKVSGFHHRVEAAIDKR